MRVMADKEFVDFLKAVHDNADNLSFAEMNKAVEAMSAYLKYEGLRKEIGDW